MEKQTESNKVMERFIINLSAQLKLAEKEIDRLKESLFLIANHPVEESQQWETGAKEMKKLASNMIENGYESKTIYSFERKVA
jgi:formyltetrahydrofolate synthetase